MKKADRLLSHHKFFHIQSAYKNIYSFSSLVALLLNSKDFRLAMKDLEYLKNIYKQTYVELF